MSKFTANGLEGSDAFEIIIKLTYPSGLQDVSATETILKFLKKTVATGKSQKTLYKFCNWPELYNLNLSRTLCT